MDKLAEGKKVFDIEIKALELVKNSLDNTFVKILDMITVCSGKVIITGMGKPGHIATKLAATFASLGTPAFYLHPAEAMHGDLGMISENDIVLAISYSGESDEILNILSGIKMIGVPLITLTGNGNSTLAKASDIVQVFPKFDEACHLGLAPTSSTTVELVYGDALAVVMSEIYGFKDSDFGKFHPAGSLGKKLLLKVDDLMVKGEDIPRIQKNAFLVDAITEISKKGIGVVSVVNRENTLVGIITDGDLRRIIERRKDIYTEIVENVMTVYPKYIKKERLAVDALHFIKQHHINNIPVVDDNQKLIGTITWQMIVAAGIVI